MKAIEQLKRHEGLRLKVYMCPAGKLTIGYGRNLEDTGITEAEAEILLTRDFFAIERELKDGEHGELFKKLKSSRQAVLINMAYNLGIAGLMTFEKMWFNLELRNFEQAAKEMLDSQWAKQVGDRADELAMQMQTGKWQG